MIEPKTTTIAEIKKDGTLTGNAFSILWDSRPEDSFTRYVTFDNWQDFVTALDAQERDESLPIEPSTRGRNKLFLD